MNPKSRRRNPKIKLARDIARITRPALKELHLGDIVSVLMTVAAGYGVQCEDFDCTSFGHLAHEMFHIGEKRLIDTIPQEELVTKKEPGLAN